MDMVTDSLLKVGHIQTGNAFNSLGLFVFFFFTVKSIQINETLGQLGTSKNTARNKNATLSFN